MVSWQARLIERRILPRGADAKAFASAESVRAAVARQALRPARYAPEAWLGAFARIGPVDPAALLGTAGEGRHGWRGYPVVDVAPKAHRTAETTVLYLHGGAYIGEIQRWHYYFLVRLARAVPARAVVPIYPLAPRGVAADVVPAMADLLADLRAAGAGRVVLMGDSAGGGLALATAMIARERGEAQPDGIVLIAPWLDVTMTHPDQAALDEIDRMLARPGLAEAGRLYAGDLDVTDPLVSPLFGDLTGLAPMTVLCGTHDLLLPDSRRLVEAAATAGVALDSHEADGLPHAYPLFPVPEGAEARAVIADACRGAR